MSHMHLMYPFVLKILPHSRIYFIINFLKVAQGSFSTWTDRFNKATKVEVSWGSSKERHLQMLRNRIEWWHFWSCKHILNRKICNWCIYVYSCIATSVPDTSFLGDVPRYASHSSGSTCFTARSNSTPSLILKPLNITAPMITIVILLNKSDYHRIRVSSSSAIPCYLLSSWQEILLNLVHSLVW